MARDRAARPEARPQRLFVAADIPVGHERAISEAIAPWRERLEGGRWEAPEKWHVTLKFLGRTWPRLVEWVGERSTAAAASVAQFEVRLGGLGVFPGPSRARVFWVGLEDPADGLARLATALDDALAPEFEPEKRRFTPHLTVARFRPPVAVRDAIEELRAARVEAEPFVVDRVVLYRSHLLGPKGSRYERLAELRLAG